MIDLYQLLAKVTFLFFVCFSSILTVAYLEKALVNMYSAKWVGPIGARLSIRPVKFLRALFKELAFYKTGSELKSVFMPMIHLAVSTFPLAVLTFTEPMVLGRSEIRSEIFYDANSLFMFLALASCNVVTTILVGWSINNNLAVLGNLKRVMQFFSIEFLLLIVIVTMSITFGSSDFHEINNIQNKKLLGSLDLNGAFLQPVGALAYFYYLTVKALYMKNMFNFELGGSRFNTGFYLNSIGLYVLMLAERINLFCHSVVFCYLFLGGYDLLPGMNVLLEYLPMGSYLFQVISLLLKSMLVLAITSSVKWLIPKLRSDQLLKKAWLFWTPVLILNLFGVFLFKIAKEMAWI